MENVVQKIGEIGIIPVIRAQTIKEAMAAVGAVCAGGIPIVEITMTVPDAISVIRCVSKELGNKVLIGAGTVTSPQQVELCLNAGAQFIVSPGLSIPVLSFAQDCTILAIPGALTPTELMSALDHGATLVKIFPCGNMGGPKYLKSLRGPFPDVALVPTGGVNLSNAGEFIAAGAYALGVGAELIHENALRTGQYETITRSARELLDTVHTVRKIHPQRAGQFQPASH